MTDQQEKSRRQNLLQKILDYDSLIAGYSKLDIPKTEKDLEEYSIHQLNQWLNLRMTRYQYLVDNEIFFDHMSCQN